MKTDVVVTKEELSAHRTAESGVWLAIDGRVYDVTRFVKRHPGGERLMLFFAGQDASDAFHSFHILPERSYVLMDTMYVGQYAGDGVLTSNGVALDADGAKSAAAAVIARAAAIAEANAAATTATTTTTTTTTAMTTTTSRKTSLGDSSSAKSGGKLSLLDDFRLLRETLHAEGLFEANVWFFMAWFAHVVLLEVAAGVVAHRWAPGVMRFVVCAALLAVSQIQAGWLQHDFGHLAVFKSIRANDFWHKVTIMALKGASATWWKTRHNRHHAKTNVLGADPDIDNDPLFVLGERMAKTRRGWALSRFQHLYWFFIGPPLVTSLLFVYQNIKFVQQRRLHEEKLWIVAYFVRFIATFATAFGPLQLVALYFAMRVVESMWFTWITRYFFL